MSDNPFAALNWSEDEAVSGEDTLNEASTTRAKDSRVCACGHPARAHASQGVTEPAKILQRAGREQCRYGRMKCPCEHFDAVIVASDVRPFSFKTTGVNTRHALYKGVSKARKNDIDVQWTKAVCAPCEAQGTVDPSSHLRIIAVTKTMQVSLEPEARNVLVCDAHYEALGGVV